MKNLVKRWGGECVFESALRSHCSTEILMQPSNDPGRKPNPWPMSWRKRSPSTSRSRATSGSQRCSLRCTNAKETTHRAWTAKCPHQPSSVPLRRGSRLRDQIHSRYQVGKQAHQVVTPEAPKRGASSALEYSAHASYCQSPVLH